RVEARAAEVVAYRADVVGEPEPVGLSRLPRRVRDVDDEPGRVTDRAGDAWDEQAGAHRGEEAAGAERDQVRRLDRLHAAVGRANVVVLQEDPLDRGFSRGANVHLLFDHAAVGELRAKVRVVER